MSQTPKTAEPLTAIRNIGPAMAQDLARAGIHTAEALRDLGADQAYARMMAHGTRPHFIGYYALVMGLQGRPWNDCKGDEKKALRQRFDALPRDQVPDNGLPAELARFLDRVGLRG